MHQLKCYQMLPWEILVAALVSHNTLFLFFFIWKQIHLMIWLYLVNSEDKMNFKQKASIYLRFDLSLDFTVFNIYLMQLCISCSKHLCDNWKRLYINVSSMKVLHISLKAVLQSGVMGPPSKNPMGPPTKNLVKRPGQDCYFYIYSRWNAEQCSLHGREYWSFNCLLFDNAWFRSEFLRSGCSKGEECQFRHEPAALKNDTVASHILVVFFIMIFVFLIMISKLLL